MACWSWTAILGTVLARALWGTHIERVTAVRFEWAPVPPAEYLNDRTAFDALVEYESQDGPGFVGIETKLSEPFSRKVYDREAYRRWMTGDGPWRPGAYPRCTESALNQLWRDHLLAWSVLRHDGSKYVRGSLAVLHHGEDHECAKAVNAYRGLLRDAATFGSMALDEIVSAWRPFAPEWAARFEERYVSLSKSAARMAERR